MKLDIIQLNCLGNREKNEDRLLVVERGKTALLVVADGMGGHRGGEIASQMVVDTLERLFNLCELPLQDPKGFLKNAIASAHTLINGEAQQHKPVIDPRTTCVACVIQGETASWAHIGDSRLYLLRDEKVLARTTDHSYVEDLFQQGLINEAEMLTHPKRSYITQCVGGETARPEVTLDEFTHLEKGDVVILCSDGLWSAVDEALICNVTEQAEFEQTINQLTQKAESSSYPQSDNITVVAARATNLDNADIEAAKDSLEHAAGNTGDHLDHAVNTINQAFEDYSNEMDYDPDTK